MPQQKELEIVIERDGKMFIHKKGFVGVECKNAVADLESLGKVLDRTPTVDMHKKPQRVRNTQGIQ
jgi:hypothetical protein